MSDSITPITHLVSSSAGPTESMVGEAHSHKFEFIDPKKGFSLSSDDKKKIIGAAMIILSIGICVIPFAMPLGVGLQIGLSVGSSVIWYGGSYIRNSGAREKEADQKAKHIIYSGPWLQAHTPHLTPRQKKALGIVGIAAAIGISLIPLAKELATLIKLGVYGGSFLVGVIGCELLRKGVIEEQVHRKVSYSDGLQTGNSPTEFC